MDKKSDLPMRRFHPKGIQTRMSRILPIFSQACLNGNFFFWETSIKWGCLFQERFKEK